MTTIKLEKTGTTPHDEIEIHAGKVQEVLNNEIPTWSMPIMGNRHPISPTATEPTRQGMDMLNQKRTFTVNGFIDSGSTLGSAQEARDTLINMARTGGTLSFKYGVPGDTYGSGYSQSADNMYYHANGFTCYITRIMIDEKAIGGSSGENTSTATKQCPEQYEVTIELTKADDITD